MSASGQIRFYAGKGFALMLFLFLVLISIGAFTDSNSGASRFSTALVVLALLSGVRASEVNRAHWIVAIVLGASAILGRELGGESESEYIKAGYNAPLLLLAAYTLVVTFAHVFRTERITPDKIYGAACVYFLIAVMWGILYALIYKFAGPGSYVFAAGTPGPHDVNSELFYYSWVTLTTLGYGDITPLHPMARVLANVEVFLGQFYLAIVVARLVALQVTQRSAPPTVVPDSSDIE